MPTEALVNPFPKELTTPPVTNMCFAIVMIPFVVDVPFSRSGGLAAAVGLFGGRMPRLR
jgi:hypothetical protein